MPTSQRAASEAPIRVIVGDTVLTGRLWDNATARDLIAQLPLCRMCTPSHRFKPLRKKSSQQ